MKQGDLRVPDLTGKVILVTGASSGIGRAAALRLSQAGARVLVQGRSRERTAEVAKIVGAEPFVADFASLKTVKSLAHQVRQSTDRLDVVLHNAGALVPKRTLTADGHELAFQGNYLASFLLQNLLQDLVAKTPGARVIVTSSGANLVGRVRLDSLDYQNRRYAPFGAYAASKLENILFVREMARRFHGTGASAIAVHPGTVASSFPNSFLPGLLQAVPSRIKLLLSVEQGAAPLVWLATKQLVDADNGRYYSRFRPDGRQSHQAFDADLARKLWIRSEEMVKPWLAE